MKDTVAAHLERMIKLLENPERWTQKYLARNSNLFPVESNDKDAVCWCQYGAMIKTKGFCADIIMHDVHTLLNSVAESLGFCDATYLNDRSDHATVMHMLEIALLHTKGAGI
jgi:hypothetical protein